MEFINTFEVVASVFITLLFSIVQMVGAAIDFIFSLANLIISLIPQCLRAWFWLFLSIRIFKFLTKRGGYSRPIASNNSGNQLSDMQSYFDNLEKEGR